MILGVVRSLFVIALISGTALAQESPVQVVDRPATAETAAPKASPAAKKQKKHKLKRKARKHKKAHRHTKAKSPASN